jgi:hypothetical protein
MKTRVLLLGVAAFALALIVVLPVSWVAAGLPAGVKCKTWRGSIWRGRCAGLVLTQSGAAPVQIESLRWRIQPLALLRLRLRAEFDLTYAQGDAEGQVELGGGQRLELHDVTARALLDSRLLGALPAGWNGQLVAEHLTVAVQGRQLLQVGGALHVRDFNDGQGTALGGYRVEFKPVAAPPFVGSIVDDGGPFEVRAALALAGDRSWVLDGTVKLQPGTDPVMERRLDLLGPADAAGLRRISAAGSFN